MHIELFYDIPIYLVVPIFINLLAKSITCYFDLVLEIFCFELLNVTLANFSNVHCHCSNSLYFAITSF